MPGSSWDLTFLAIRTPHRLRSQSGISNQREPIAVRMLILALSCMVPLSGMLLPTQSRQPSLGSIPSSVVALFTTTQCLAESRRNLNDAMTSFEEPSVGSGGSHVPRHTPTPTHFPILLRPRWVSPGGLSVPCINPLILALYHDEGKEGQSSRSTG